MESQTKTQTIPIYEQNIEKLQPHSNYEKAEMINTKFGPTYLLTDDKGYKRFANKRLNDFILRNFTDDKFQKSKLFHPNLIVETGKYRTFEKDGKQITYLNMEIRA